jgi:hypothetical protein
VPRIVGIRLISTPRGQRKFLRCGKMAVEQEVRRGKVEEGEGFGDFVPENTARGY